MHPDATNGLLVQHLAAVRGRAEALGWVTRVVETRLTVDMRQSKTGETYRLLVLGDDYPLVPVAVQFLPLPPRLAEAKWPFDGNRVFRTEAPRPFVCLSGVRSYVPESAEPDMQLGLDDLHVGAVLTRLQQAIDSDWCSGAIYVRLG